MYVKPDQEIARTSIGSVVIFIFACSIMWAQSTKTLQPSPNRNSEAFAKAENKWRLTPVDPQLQTDKTAANIRADRNAYWRPLLQRERERETGGRSVAMTGGPPSLNEVADNPDSVWVVASLDHYLVQPADQDFKLLYTEMSFRVNQIIKQPKALFTPGMFFDVDIEGGSIKTPHGDIVSWHISPRRFFVQPGHTYIMEIRPLEVGQLYFIGKIWDVSSGKVVADHADEVSRAAQGHSKLNGMATQDAVSYLQSVLASGSLK
jgi:hypothetical protein